MNTKINVKGILGGKISSNAKRDIYMVKVRGIYTLSLFSFYLFLLVFYKSMIVFTTLS